VLGREGEVVLHESVGQELRLVLLMHAFHTRPGRCERASPFFGQVRMARLRAQGQEKKHKTEIQNRNLDSKSRL